MSSDGGLDVLTKLSGRQKLNASSSGGEGGLRSSWLIGRFGLSQAPASHPETSPLGNLSWRLSFDQSRFKLLKRPFEQSNYLVLPRRLLSLTQTRQLTRHHVRVPFAAPVVEHRQHDQQRHAIPPTASPCFIRPGSSRKWPLIL
jgi:hypothetical protein